MSTNSDPLDLYGLSVWPESPKVKKPKPVWAVDPQAPEVPKKKWVSPPQLVPPPTLSQAEWDQMEGKARWDSIVALRGPDLIGSECLKWFTSSVIRHRMSKIMRVGGLVNNLHGFVVLPDGGYSTSKTKPFDISHFIGHVQEAADWLGIPIVYCSSSTFELILTGGYHARGAVLQKLLSGGCLTGELKERVLNLLGSSEGSAE